MVVEAVQNYVNMVNGLSKMTRDRALATAKALLGHAGLEDVANDASERVSKLAEEIMVASRANRELVENLVAAEVDKAAARWGFVRTEEVNALREEIAELRLSLARATVDAASGKPAAKKSPGRRPTARAESAPAGAPPARPAETSAQQPPLGGTPGEGSDEQVLEDLVPSEPLPYEPGPIQSNADRRAAARKPPSPRKSAAKTPAAKSPAAKTPAAKTTAEKSAAKKAPAKRAPAKRAPAQKSADTASMAESLAPLATFTPVTDPDATE